jgi:hypothetical protein
MDFATMKSHFFSTFTYWIDVCPCKKPQEMISLSYEEILGIGKPDWDLLQSDRLDHHSDIFVEVVGRTLEAVSMSLKG